MYYKFIQSLTQNQEFIDLLSEVSYKIPLYHYTNIDGLYGIIREKAFRSFDIRFMNDPSDAGGYSLELVNEWLKSSDFGEEEREILSFLPNLLSAKIDEDIRCVICLSRAFDRLSQWRGYSNNSIGYCIEFDNSKWDSILGTSFHMRSIEYEKAKQMKIIQSVFKAGSDFKRDNPVEEKEYSEAIITILLIILQNFKHPSYYEEEEVRITYSHLMSFTKKEKIEYITKNGFIVPYVRFEIPVDSIKRIYIENKPGARLAKLTIENYLQSEGLSIDCQISNIPRR